MNARPSSFSRRPVGVNQRRRNRRKKRRAYFGVSMRLRARKRRRLTGAAMIAAMAVEARSKRSEDSLAKRLLSGDKRALARGISLVENDDPAGWELVREVYPKTGKARVVGFTGPPGVGKSTLIGALVKHARGLSKQVAVLSIDPSSPFTEGALLGDRIRLADHFLDEGVYIRSMASRGADR